MHVRIACPLFAPGPASAPDEPLPLFALSSSGAVAVRGLHLRAPPDGEAQGVEARGKAAVSVLRMWLEAEGELPASWAAGGEAETPGGRKRRRGSATADGRGTRVGTLEGEVVSGALS